MSAITPSWQDAAERWEAAYDEAKAENAVLKEALQQSEEARVAAILRLAEAGL